MTPNERAELKAEIEAGPAMQLMPRIALVALLADLERLEGELTEWRANGYKSEAHIYLDKLAAVKEETERCAQIAERHFIYGHSVAGPHFAAVCAAAIRARSQT